jgi:serine/threonine protein kinase
MSAAPGRYEILEEIGRGGTGHVVKARDSTLGRLVAIKLVRVGGNPEAQSRLQREARSSAILSHPNIVTAYDFGTADDLVYVVMEYVVGRTLQQRMQSVPPTEWARFLPALVQCGDALDFAHRRGIVHRDIKPSNIMIGDNGVPKILDFGIAKLAADREMSRTADGDLLGTPLFMAPEQVRGQPAGPQTDQYALALIAYNLLAGTHPLSAESTYGLLQAIVLVPPPPPSRWNPSLTRGIDQVLLKALSKDPAERFGSCRELFDALYGAESEIQEIPATTSAAPASAAPTVTAPPAKGGAAPAGGLWESIKRVFSFGKVEPAPAEPPVPPPKSASSLTVEAPVASPPQTYTPPRPANQGGYDTGSFSLPASPPQAIPPAAPPAPTPAELDEFEKLFQLRPDPAPIPPSPPPPPPSSEPGSFTSLFQAPRDSFTEMFQRPPDSAQSPPPPVPPPIPSPAAFPASPHSPPPPSTGPGEFTRVFKAAEQTLILRKAPEQRVDAETLVRAQARELTEILERRDFESAVALRGKWLPGIEGASGELVGFSEAARYLGAAQDAVSPHVRIEHLKRAEKVLFSVGNQLLADTTPASRHLPEALEAWKLYARELLGAAQQKAATEIPNPFRAGQPLAPDQGRAVFRGRNALVRRIEAILADADQNSSLALLGPRRCGKTSLLRMLPAMLPDCACVFFDLQDNPVSTVPEFFEALVRRAREQVRTHRRLELPSLEGASTFESATRWFDQLDQVAEANRFLISIDEFERLEDLFPGDRRDLLRLMGLFRATIQHRRKVRLLVSGVAPFEELGSLWNDHFINVRELSIGHLDEETSIDLLCRPIPEFPPESVSASVAREIFRRTGGQPYLLQLFGSLLINRLNELERSNAALADIEPVEQDALSQGRYYFGNTYQDAPPKARDLLEALAHGEKPTIAGATRRWLERRWLIDEEGALRTPVLGAFIRDELGL